MTTQYLEMLKESTINAQPSVKNYSLNWGEDLIEDILIREGIFLDESVLNEGIFSMPINKIKSIAGGITQDISSPEGLKKIKEKYGKMASSITPSDLKNQAVKLAASKGISEEEVNSTFEKILRALVTLKLATFTILTPIGWILIIVSLIKSGSMDSFGKNIKEMMAEIAKGIDRKEGKFDQVLNLGSTAWKFILVCLIPPWFQAVVLAPAAGILIILAFILYIVEVLKIMKP